MIFTDSRAAIFYYNDLRRTPSTNILESCAEAIECVNELTTQSRWVKGNDVFHRSELRVPVIIVAYVLFMNSVDLMDQRRSTNVIRCKEVRLLMTMFGLILDLSISNGYTIVKNINRENSNDKIFPFKEFKSCVTAQLIKGWSN